VRITSPAWLIFYVLQYIISVAIIFISAGWAKRGKLNYSTPT
jgi:hypothetical protein